jgi:hypothetical protein
MEIPDLITPDWYKDITTDGDNLRDSRISFPSYLSRDIKRRRHGGVSSHCKTYLYDRSLSLEGTMNSATYATHEAYAIG